MKVFLSEPSGIMVLVILVFSSFCNIKFAQDINGLLIWGTKGGNANEFGEGGIRIAIMSPAVNSVAKTMNSQRLGYH